MLLPEITWRPSPLQVSIFVNVITIGLLVYLWRKPAPPVDGSLHDLAVKNNQTLVDLGKQIEIFNKEREKALADYQAAVQTSIVDHDKRLAELEKKKTDTAKKILGDHKNDLPGLAKDFSTVMGLGSN